MAFCTTKSDRPKYRIYIAYHAKTSEIVAFVWGKRDLQTALALKQRLKELKVSYERIAGDNWDAFVNAFSDTGDQWVGKQHTKAIEGNNCRIRHRLSRAVSAVAVFPNQCFIMLNLLILDFRQSIIPNKFNPAHFSGHHQ